MKISRIYAENYKTYRQLDLNLEVDENRPIILIGGGNGCGKTTLFDAIYCALYGLNTDQVEYAAEIAMEHNLGLTCDPVDGLVQIPCIERNAVAAMRAISSVNLSRFLFTTRKISFDEVVETMYRTGKDMDEKYRETAHGGLAQIYRMG